MHYRVAIASHRPILQSLVAEVMRGTGDVEIVALFRSHAELLQDVLRLTEAKCNIVIIDATRTSCLYEAITEVRKAARECRPLVVCNSVGDYVLTRASSAGAMGIVAECDQAEEWRSAIQTVCRGGVYQSASCVHAKDSLAIACMLTAQESRVLPLVCLGSSDEAVGKALGISPLTAEGHRSSLMRKLAVPDAAGLIAFGVAAGVVAASEIDYSSRHRRSAGGDRRSAKQSVRTTPG